MKVLVVRFSSIGDIVLTTPVIRCLKKAGHEVHFLTKKTYRDLADHNPNIDRSFFLEDNLTGIISEFKKENYDCIIDLHHNLRTFILKIALGKKSFSFPKLNFEKWLMVNFKINRLPGKHIVERYFETTKALGIKNDGMGLDFFLPPGCEVDLKSLSLEPNNYIAFAMGGKFSTKRIPPEKIISICKKINKPVVLIGGKEDFENAKVICERAGTQLINACGKFSLLQSAYLIKNSYKVITHDTGMMHIGAAFGKEICSVWGSTIPEFGMSPYYGLSPVDGKKIQVDGLNCRPCSKLGFGACPKGHFKCMNLIDEDEIVSFVNV